MSDSSVPPVDSAEWQALRVRYWRINLIILAVFLTLWFVVSILGGIVFAEYLNQFHLGGYPLGFWIAQQGSIYLFVLLVLGYALLMRRLDRMFTPRKPS